MIVNRKSSYYKIKKERNTSAAKCKIYNLLLSYNIKNT